MKTINKNQLEAINGGSFLDMSKVDLIIGLLATHGLTTCFSSSFPRGDLVKAASVLVVAGAWKTIYNYDYSSVLYSEEAAE